MLLMIASTTADYLIAHAIARASNQSKRKRLLLLSLILNFGILGIFKYFNFFIGSFAHLVQSLGVTEIPISVIKIILPPGISFYTFQEVAYIVDVYNGKTRASRQLCSICVVHQPFPSSHCRTDPKTGSLATPGAKAAILGQRQSTRWHDSDS